MQEPPKCATLTTYIGFLLHDALGESKIMVQSSASSGTPVSCLPKHLSWLASYASSMVPSLSSKGRTFVQPCSSLKKTPIFFRPY